jgi:DNA-binding LytR/AlgR family response regulator
MDRLKTLLVHPDPAVRASLRQHLRDADFVQVLGETVSAFEAMELLEAIPYSVFFLGVDLPDGVSGIELAQMLAGRKRKPALIFLAPDESLAFQAFELGAVDYLLWPFTAERVRRTTDRLRQLRVGFREVQPAASWTGGTPSSWVEDEETVQVPMGEEDEDRFMHALKNAWDSGQPRPLEIEKLPISLDGRMVLVPYTQIVFVEAYEDYSYVHTAAQKFLTSYRLKNLEDRLRPHRFFRVHRKFLVNLDMVTEIASLPGSNFMLRTAGKTRIELPISRRRIADLKGILGL